MEMTTSEALEILQKWVGESSLIEGFLVVTGEPSLGIPDQPGTKILSRVLGQLALSSENRVLAVHKGTSRIALNYVNGRFDYFDAREDTDSPESTAERYICGMRISFECGAQCFLYERRRGIESPSA